MQGQDLEFPYIIFQIPMLMGMNDTICALRELTGSFKCPSLYSRIVAAFVILWAGAWPSRACRPCSSSDRKPEWLKRLQHLVMNLAFRFGKSTWLV